MKKLALLLAAPLALALAACGGTDSTSFSLASGNYAPSAATATSAYPADNCNVVPLFSTGSDPFPVVVASDGKSATFNFTSVDAANRKETVAIDGNAITGTVSANYQITVGTTCAASVTVKVVNGELTANNDMHLVVQYDIANNVGSLCTTTDLDTKVLPCTSQVDFLAKK